jgi:DNA-binding CsgD family transcriptional regulator
MGSADVDGSLARPSVAAFSGPMSVPAPSLVGRHAEMAHISGLLGRAAQGSGELLLIEGEAGIGKTRVLDEALVVAQGFGFTVIHCHGEELERRRPFGILAEGLGLDRRSPDDQRAAIGRLLAGSAPADAGQSPFVVAAEAEFRITEAILVLVEDLCAPRPVALAVEDLQWADPSSLTVLHRLGRLVRHLPLVLVGTLRPVPRPAELARLLESLLARGATHMTLGPLGDQAVVELIRALIGADLGPNLVTQAMGAGGNPLFVMELLRTLDREGLLHRTGAGKVDVRQATVPPSLRLTVLHSLQALPDEAVEMLRVASVLGATFSVDDLSLVLATPAAELVGPLRECLRSGVLAEEGERLAFRHDLIREALYEDLPEGLRLALHLQAGRALAAAGRPPERVAEQLGRGASPGDRQAVEWLHRAAREAAPRSPSVAVEILQRALALSHPSDPGRDQLLAEQAMSLLWSGRLPEAEAVCRRVLDRPHDHAVDGMVRGCLVNAVVLSGRSAEAIEDVLSAVSTADLAPVERVRLVAWASLGLMILGDLARSAEVAREAAEGGQRLGDDVASCIGLGVMGVVTAYRGGFHEGCRLAGRAVELADRSEGRQAHRFPMHFFRAILLLTIDRFVEARDDIVRGRRIAEELGTRWALPLYHWLSMQERFWAGEWDDAIVHYEAGMTLAEDTGMREGTIAGAVLRGLIAIHCGDLEKATEAAHIAHREFQTTGPQGQAWAWMMFFQGLLLEAAGDIDQATSSLSKAWELATTAELAITYPLLGPELVRLALATGDRQRAETVVGTLEDLQRRNGGISSLAGAALLSRGQVSGDADVLLDAVAAYREGPRLLERGQACEVVGGALARLGRLDESRTLFDDALGTYEALGAFRDLARTEAVLRGFGVRRGRRGPRRRPRFGWAALTERETQVVALMADGLSNPQIAERMFLSRHTVHTHVAHILAKLGLSSRVELAREAARRRD